MKILKTLKAIKLNELGKLVFFCKSKINKKIIKKNIKCKKVNIIKKKNNKKIIIS
ncbi:hypothetical protein ACT2CI_00705 [Candidatus Vidania fulgoroideorum]